MNKKSTYNPTESIIENPIKWSKDIIMKLPCPELSVVIIYTFLASSVIFIVLSCFYKEIKKYEYIRLTSINYSSFIKTFVISLIFKLLSSYFFYIIITEFKSLYFNIYVYIRAIPLLLFVIYYFLILICVYNFDYSIYYIKRLNLLSVIFYVLFIFKLCSTAILFSLLIVDIKLKTEILILLAITLIEIIHINFILLLPQIFKYYDIKNGQKGDLSPIKYFNSIFYHRYNNSLQFQV